jgi:hypothetical protein
MKRFNYVFLLVAFLSLFFESSITAVQKKKSYKIARKKNNHLKHKKKKGKQHKKRKVHPHGKNVKFSSKHKHSRKKTRTKHCLKFRCKKRKQ